MCTLYKLIEEAQKGQEGSTLALLERFQPLLKKHARMLGYEDALPDLTVAFFYLLLVLIHLKQLQYL